MALIPGSPMEDVFEKTLASYRRYYDIDRETPAAPFDAEAVFTHHSEQYMFTRSVKLSAQDSGEYVFFAVADGLTDRLFTELDAAAWETGLSRVTPGPEHKNTDVTLIILAEHVPEELAKRIRRTSHTKGYRLGLYGYSNYRLAVYDRAADKAYANRLGQDLVNIFTRGNKGKEKQS